MQGGHVLIGTFCRLRNVQGQTTEMWRRETWMSTMCEAQGGVRRLQEGLQMATIRGDERQSEHRPTKARCVLVYPPHRTWC